MSDVWKEQNPEVEFSQKETQHINKQIPAEMWREFVNNTTLHGIRYVFMKRHILTRLLWLVLLLTSGGYYVSVVYGAVNKYYDRPINTVVSRKHLKQMDFPAVTICPLNMFTKSKIFMTDNNPLQVLLDAMEKSFHRPDQEEFFRHYSQNISTLVGPMCYFGWEELDCFANEFVPLVTPRGMCYTFNSGTDGKVKTVNSAGVSTGLTVILDAQTHEYTYGRYSEGFKVLVHGQGEYMDDWEGINVGPGQHVLIALLQKRVCIF